jgi:signal transduction histidine kinase
MKEISVLFLDDEQNVLNSISRLFMNEAYGVAVAGNCEEATAIMAREKIKVVFSDQRMPDITGIEFLRRIKTRYPDAIRILFTAYADLTATEAAINISEVYRFINKPWQPDELKAAVAGAIHYFDIVMENRHLFNETNIKNEALELANSKLKVLYDVQKEFSSTLSHELRTPLASIKAAIDIVISGTTGEITAEQKNFLGRAKSNVDRLNRLINDILDLAHLESGKATLNKQSGDINKVIQSVAESQESVARARGLYLKVSLDPSVPVLSLDQDKITQVLNNLIANALKFTEAGGITVSSQTDEGKNQVEIRIQDTGCGIKEEDVAKLFEKFQQLGEAHQRQAGTGLGLAICKEIVRQHGGKVGVQSKKDDGSCFYFILPVEQRKG